MLRKVLDIGIADSRYTMSSIPFKTWYDMLTRCYSYSSCVNYPSYSDCYVCEEWLDFSNFLKWWQENYYIVEAERMCLDKDILFKRNKVYSPSTCIYAPIKINCLFTIKKRKSHWLPLGVDYNYNNSRTFVATLMRNGKSISKRGFKSPQDAFDFYKSEKELEIKCIAERYKNRIPQKLYNAMLNYNVEITD